MTDFILDSHEELPVGKDDALIGKVADWVVDGGKGDLPYSFYAKEIVKIVREHDKARMKELLTVKPI